MEIDMKWIRKDLENQITLGTWYAVSLILSIQLLSQADFKEVEEKEKKPECWEWE